MLGVLPISGAVPFGGFGGLTSSIIMPYEAWAIRSRQAISLTSACYHRFRLGYVPYDRSMREPFTCCPVGRYRQKPAGSCEDSVGRRRRRRCHLGRIHHIVDCRMVTRSFDDLLGPLP